MLRLIRTSWECLAVKSTLRKKLFLSESCSMLVWKPDMKEHPFGGEGDGPDCTNAGSGMSHFAYGYAVA